MGDEVLTLKTSGGRLWEIVHEPIADAVAQLDGGPYELRLGGGTTLAARWEHRDSYDIDLTVEDGAGLRDLADPENPFRRHMRESGGKPEYLSRQWKVTFPTGEVDLTEMNPVPPGAERRGIVGGIPVTVLANAQILHGKLDRADASPVRDVFDFIKARDLDPQALSAAVNCRSREDIEVIAITWERADATLRETSTDHLLGIPKHFDEDRSTLGSNAADALRGAIYSRVTVQTDPGQAIVDTRTNSGITGRIEIPKDRIGETLVSSGLSQYFRTHVFGGKRIEQAVRGACSTSTGPRILWETGMRLPQVPETGTKRHTSRDR